MLTVENLRLTYPIQGGSFLAVNDVSFEVRQGEFFTLLGPSGCGKTTTLRSVAGLETPDGGVIRIDGSYVFNAARAIVAPTNRRDISMVFQSYAIWPHMNVFGNVAFPLEAKGVDAATMRGKVLAALDIVGLGSFADRPATQLSGGQQQRVALARAIIKEAKVLLLDEPLSNLDAKLREHMRYELRDLQTRIDTTAIYVTHDQEEALTMSDRIALMRSGRIVELGSPKELYLTPKTTFAARFLGQANLIPCGDVETIGNGLRGRTELGDLVSANGDAPGAGVAWAMIRPEHVEVGPHALQGPNRFTATITNATFTGRLVEYALDVSGRELRSVVPSSSLHEVGQTVDINLPPERIVFLPDDPDEPAR